MKDNPRSIFERGTIKVPAGSEAYVLKLYVIHSAYFENLIPKLFDECPFLFSCVAEAWCLLRTRALLLSNVNSSINVFMAAFASSGQGLNY